MQAGMRREMKVFLWLRVRFLSDITDDYWLLHVITALPTTCKALYIVLNCTKCAIQIKFDWLLDVTVVATLKLFIHLSTRKEKTKFIYIKCTVLQLDALFSLWAWSKVKEATAPTILFLQVMTWRHVNVQQEFHYNYSPDQMSRCLWSSHYQTCSEYAR